MDTLPGDIILNHICPLLPPESLRCIRCAYESWDSIIGDLTHGHLLFVSPDQKTSQPNVFSSPLHLFQPNVHVATPPSATLRRLPLPNLSYSDVRVQCVNGLLCFHPRSTTRFSYLRDAFAHVGNPATEQVITLPPDESIRGEILVSTHFGYDPFRDEFKVLRLIKNQRCSEFKVFTVGVDNSWRRIAPESPFIPMLCLLYRGRGLCVNGAVHWTYDSLNIVAFDVGNEKFRVMPAPSGYLYKEGESPHMRFPDLVEIGGCLSLIGYGDSVLNLWILKDYQAQVWEHRSIVLPYGFGLQHRIVFPLCRVHTGEILLLPYFLPKRVRVFYYDMDEMSSRRVVAMEMPQGLGPDQGSGEVDIFFYQENFRLLN